MPESSGSSLSEEQPARLEVTPRTILRLVVFGLVYNLTEGILGAGVAAGSVVLVGFGLDSGIETVAAFDGALARS